VRRVVRHRWNVSIRRAREIQEELRGKVSMERMRGTVRNVAGLDISYDAATNRMYAAAIVMEARGLTVVERRWLSREVTFPYVPGYLSFREAPALAAVLMRLRTDVDLVLCDGQGIAHPRGLGLASHIGVLFDIATIGVAKSRLVGEHNAVGERAGDSSALMVAGSLAGYVVRTREGVKPLYVSPGHRIDPVSARRWVLKLCRGYRVCEPTRQAHLMVSEVKRRSPRWK